MAPSQPKSGIFVGANRGHVVTKRELAKRPSDRKGVCCCLNLFKYFVFCCLLRVCYFLKLVTCV